MVNGVSNSTVQSAMSLMKGTGGAMMRKELDREAQQVSDLLGGVVQSPSASPAGQGDRVDVYA
jgi:hypothetical protein